VTGMSCAACSARVEKAVNKVEGVESVTVNLLKNSMAVDFNPEITGPEQIRQAVEDAGYGASEKNEEVTATSHKATVHKEESEDEEIKNMKLRLWVSIVFSVPLMYIAMAPMLGLPNPSILEGEANASVNALTQFLLTIPVIFINFKFFRNGFKSLWQLSPNMDSLVGIGSAASAGFGIFALFMIVWAQGHGDLQIVHHYAHNLYFDSAAMILTLITLGKYFETRAKRRTTNAISKLLELVPETATIQKDGKEETVPVDSIVPGNLVVLKTGERIPVDGIVEQGEGFVDESSLTGESVPAEKVKGSLLSGGTLVTQGHMVMLVQKVGADTALAQIIKLVDEATSSKAPVNRLADKVSGIFVPVVIAIAIVTFIAWILFGQSWEFALVCAVSVLVISCPCALGLATPTAIMVGSGKGAENGILFKSAEAIETGEKADAVVLDKTGTVTEGHPSLTDLICSSGIDPKKLLSKVSAIEVKSEHPLAAAIVRGTNLIGVEPLESTNFKQVLGSVSGSVDGEKIQIGNWNLLGNSYPSTKDLMEKLATEGKTPLVVLVNGVPNAVLGIADPIKKDSIVAVKAMQERDQQVWMVTGDNTVTAKAVANKLGITNVESEVLPADKEKIVKKLQEEGKIVMMVGDGINDAPALARANIGTAIGTGTDVAIESADVVVMKSRLTDVVNAEYLSAATMRNIRQNLFWAFFYNIIGIPIAAGVFFPLLGWTLNPMIAAAAMSMSSVSVVSNALRLRGWKPHFKETKLDPTYKEKPVDIKLSSFETEQKEEETMKKFKLVIDGMMCNHCTNTVAKGLSSIPGVSDVSVDLNTKTAEGEVENDVSLQTLSDAVDKLGYKVTSATYQDS
ncbi:MAG: heavy metal translocating P-type ATPase, partial [Burkholderiales bacterium]|nr:heavy metal translocating P-type ATPase [Burkholderiales bacterium]